jgi:hypothetical protein
VWNEDISMSKSVAAIRSVTARALVVPISRPAGRTSTNCAKVARSKCDRVRLAILQNVIHVEVDYAPNPRFPVAMARIKAWVLEAVHLLENRAFASFLDF